MVDVVGASTYAPKDKVSAPVAASMSKLILILSHYAQAIHVTQAALAS